MKSPKIPALLAATFLIVIAMQAVPALATPVTYSYVNWTAATMSNGSTSGSATGTITAGSQTINVSYTGDVPGAQTNGSGQNYYLPASTFENSTVANAPTSPDIIQLAEGYPYTDTLTFSSAIVNPIIDIVSLGAPGNTVSYNFNAAPTILGQGTDDWNGCNTCLTVSGNTLSGTEGSGVIQFDGTITSISWTATGGEYWNGITVGEVAAAPTPTPEPGSILLLGTGLMGLALLVRRKIGLSA
jgi:hypothetical protein